MIQRFCQTCNVFIAFVIVFCNNDLNLRIPFFLVRRDYSGLVALFTASFLLPLSLICFISVSLSLSLSPFFSPPLLTFFPSEKRGLRINESMRSCIMFNQVVYIMRCSFLMEGHAVSSTSARITQAISGMRTHGTANETYLLRNELCLSAFPKAH